MADIIISVSKADMKVMERNANMMLERKGLSVDEYWYQQHLQIVTENMNLLVSEIIELEE